jgi:hypothetical protein
LDALTEPENEVRVLTYKTPGNDLRRKPDALPIRWADKNVQPTTVSHAQPHLPKWSLRAYAGGGLAMQGLFDHSSKMTTYYIAPASPGIFSSSGGYTKVLAARRLGAGWEGGIDFQYRLSGHWYAGIGLTYDHWQTAFSNVEKVNSSQPIYALLPASSSVSYYEGGSGSPYVNTYQWMQLPIRITWAIAPLKAWNPSLFTGVTIGYMIADNALSYSTSEVAYQHAPPDLFRKWTVYWQGGLECTLGQLGRYGFFTGPLVQYDLSGLQAGAVNHDHLSYAGIRLGIVLNRKNIK